MGVLNKVQPLALLVLRLAIGAIMTAHGWQKIHGGTGHFVQVVHGLGMPGWLAYIAVATEFLGGILLMVGFGTRIAALFVMAEMLVAITKVHLHNGLLAANGYQFPLILVAVAFALICFGSGEISVDWLTGSGGGRGK